MAPWLPRTPVTVMNGVTAILVVLMLTGSPVSSVACAVACDRSTTATAYYHEHMTDHATAMAVAVDEACDVLASDAPYVTENTMPLAIADATAMLAFIPASALASHRFTEISAGACLAPPFVLRL